MNKKEEKKLKNKRLQHKLGLGIMTSAIFITLYMNPNLRLPLIIFLLGLYCYKGIVIQIKIFEDGELK